MSYKCPNCGDAEHLDVSAHIWVRLQSDGQTDADEAHNHDHEWDNTSMMHCDACGHDEVAEAFEVDEEPELQCTQNTPEVHRKILEQASDKFGPRHGKMQADFEHGQWFITCVDCGRQWSVNDGEIFFVFEEVSHGDEYCDH